MKLFRFRRMNLNICLFRNLMKLHLDGRFFESFKKFNQDLYQLTNQPYIQWIDGSFVTNKFSPGDIDVVSFLDFRLLENDKNELQINFGKQSSSRNYPFVDAYLLADYPAEHPFCKVFQSDKAYWFDHFGHTRFNRNKVRFKKGIIELSIEKIWK